MRSVHHYTVRSYPRDISFEVLKLPFQTTMTLAVVARTPVPRTQGNLKRGRAAKAPAKAAKPAGSIKAPVAVKVAAGVAPSVVPAKVKAVGTTKAVSAHPGYAKMVHEALKHLQDRKGSSRQAILKYIMANFTVGNDQKPVNNHLKKALVGGTKNGNLKNVGQGKGASGLFKLPEKLTQEAPASKPKVPARKRAADSQTAAPQANKKAKVTKTPASTTRTSPASAAKKSAKATEVTTAPSDAAKNVEAAVSQAQPQASTPKQVAPKKRWGQRQQTQPTKLTPASKAPARSDNKSVNSVAQAAPSTQVPAPAPTAAPVSQPRSRTRPAVAKRASKVPQPQRAGGKQTKPQGAQPQAVEAVEAVEASTPTPVPQPSRAKAAANPVQPQGQRSQARRGTQEAPMPAPQTASLPQSTGLFGREAVNGAAIQSPAMKAIRRSRWGQGPTEQNQNQENPGPVFGPIPKPADYVEQPEAHQPGPVYGPAPRPAGYTDAA